jgi:DNA modification methylase
MSESFLDGKVILHCGDCLDILSGLPDNHFDSCCTDPPYGLEFMGKEWDKFGDVTRANRGTQPKRARPAGESGTSQKFQLPSPAFDLSPQARISFQKWCEQWAREVYRVLKPGAHLVAFGGTRTGHRLACAIENVGFEIRDSITDLIASDTFVRGFLDSLNDEQRGAFARCIDESQFGGILQWIFGQGFPKSHDAAQSIEKFLTTGAARRPDRDLGGLSRNRFSGDIEGGLIANTGGKVKLTTEQAKEFEGFGTALKPAAELICLARKPLSESTVAANVLKWRTGALNIDGCKVAGGTENARTNKGGYLGLHGGERPDMAYSGSEGRWPANVITDSSVEVVGAFPDTGVSSGGKGEASQKSALAGRIYGDYGGAVLGQNAGGLGDSGSAARFFYAAKPDDPPGRWPANVVTDGSDEVVGAFPDSEVSGSARNGRPAVRNENRRGVTSFDAAKGSGTLHNDSGSASRFYYTAKADADDRLGSKHPTIKPLDLIQYLERLVTPPNGLILDLFAGTGTAGEAAWREGFRAVLIEREAEYQADIRRRMALVLGSQRERRTETTKARAKDKPVDHGPLFGGKE